MEWAFLLLGSGEALLVTDFGQQKVAEVVMRQFHIHTVKCLVQVSLFLLLCHHYDKMPKTACWRIGDHGQSQVAPVVLDEALLDQLTASQHL